MQRFEGSDQARGHLKMPAVAMGNFDGVHLGHQAVIGEAIREAQDLQGTSLVYTFEPHPVSILSPAQCPPLLCTREQKLERIEALGVDAAILEPFTEAFARLSAEAFFHEIVLKRLGAKALVVGYDFTFGMHRQGIVEMLEALGTKAGIRTVIVPAQFSGETLISSTVIRQMIRRGEVDRARALLGRPYEIVGTVVPGRGLGRELRARTANIRTPQNGILPDGIYITNTRLLRPASGAKAPISLPSITSIGNNPTFPDSAHVIETHLLDVERDIMGWTLAIDFLSFIRTQVRFASVEELTAQIHRDIAEAREYHRRGKERR